MKTRKILMALVGVYLTYIGGMLIKDTISGMPKNEIIFYIFGGIFVLFGLATVIMNIKDFISDSKSDGEDDSEEDDAEE